MTSCRRWNRLAFGLAAAVQVSIAAAYARLTDGCMCAIDGIGPPILYSAQLVWIVRVGGLPLSLIPSRLYSVEGIERTLERLRLPSSDWPWVITGLVANFYLWWAGTFLILRGAEFLLAGARLRSRPAP